jgi:hypothetical protein
MRKLAMMLTLGAMVCSADTAAAQTITAFKTGERTTGMTKQCFYEALGSSYTKTIGSVELCPLTVQVRQAPKPTAPPAPPVPATIAAFKTGERTTGMTKQCFYEALGNGYTKTVRSIDLCPLTIQVRL